MNNARKVQSGGAVWKYINGGGGFFQLQNDLKRPEMQINF